VSIVSPVDGHLLMRIRMEYVEMPGLRLTSRQAGRLWGLDQTACEAILATLVQELFLSRTSDGAYLRRDSGRQRPPSAPPGPVHVGRGSGTP
jgi:hypothetical protein